MFTFCISENQISSCWKKDIVRPHYKGKSGKLDSDSYSSISAICPIAKIFESLVSDKKVNYLEVNGFISNAKYGFRKGLSCEQVVHFIVDDWCWALDRKESALFVFFIPRKAFDTVDHRLLIEELKYYNNCQIW